MKKERITVKQIRDSLIEEVTAMNGALKYGSLNRMDQVKLENRIEAHQFTLELIDGKANGESEKESSMQGHVLSNSEAPEKRASV